MDLAGMNAEFSGQFADRTVALDGGQRHLRFERRAMLLSSLLHVLLLSLCHL